MDNSIKKEGIVKFVSLSLLGIIMFFIPLLHGEVPIVCIVNMIKNALGKNLYIIVLFSEVTLAVMFFGARVCKIQFCKRYFKGDSVVKQIMYLFGIVLTIVLLIKPDIAPIRNPQIGGKLLPMSATIFLTISLAGTFVVLVIRSGIVEFVSVLAEPFMRPIFKLPGEAAINMISSFVSSASVGVYFTNCYYEKKTYTTKEACAVVTNFSVISVGYIGILASIAGIESMYGVILLSSFVLVLIMSAIMIRIPPLSRMSNSYIDKTPFEHGEEIKRETSAMHSALQVGVKTADDFTFAHVKQNLVQALCFAQKIVGVMLPTVTIVLTLAYYTPIFKFLGYLVLPILKLMGVPEADQIAPSVLIGIIEISLPSILLAGAKVSKAAAFFVVELSIVQIIFFSEAGNAILGSKIPLSVGKLILIFLVRTLVALPLVAMLTHILF